MQQSRIRSESRDPIYGPEQVDQMIMTPEARSVVMTTKKPRYEKIPVYATDEKGDKIPLLDEKGNMIVDSDGVPRYLVKDYEYVQRGYLPVHEIIPASELFTIDLATSNLSSDAVILVTREMWDYNFLLSLQASTDADYSVLLHKIRNDIMSVLNAAKSYNGGTVAAVKTYRAINDNRQWTYQDEQAEQQKKNGNPLSMLFGGSKKSGEPKDSENRYTAFQK